MRSEKYSFEHLLTGAENMENFQYNAFDFNKIEPRQKDSYLALNCLLRDTLRIFYMRGFESMKLPVDSSLDVKSDPNVHSIIKLALLVTSKYLG